MEGEVVPGVTLYRSLLLLLGGPREQDYQGGHIRQQFSQFGGYLNLFMYLGK